MVAHVELYQGGDVTRSAAVQILLVTGVTVRRHLTSRSRAAVLILVVTPVTDCRRELIQLLYYQRVTFMTGLRLCLKPHFAGKRSCNTFCTRPTCFYVFRRRRFYSVCYWSNSLAAGAPTTRPLLEQVRFGADVPDNTSEVTCDIVSHVKMPS